MSGKFEDLVDLEGLDEQDRDRLRGVHDLLVAAGPPPELTPALATPPAEDDPKANVIPIRSRRRSLVAGLAFAAVVAAAAFGGGLLLGGNDGHGIDAVKVVPMQGEQNSLASIKIGKLDANGNSPMEFTVAGLPMLPSQADYYILMLERNGKPRFPCGWFRVSNGTTTVRFTVPYKIDKSSRWVVTSMRPGMVFPGHVVMTTS